MPVKSDGAGSEGSGAAALEAPWIDSRWLAGSPATPTVSEGPEEPSYWLLQEWHRNVPWIVFCATPTLQPALMWSALRLPLAVLSKLT